jgi:hypothetical protein
MTSPYTTSAEVNDLGKKSRPDFGNARKWRSQVTYGDNRRQALRSALAQLPLGVTWDVVLRHSDGCPNLEDWGELADCTCSSIQLEAQELR